MELKVGLNEAGQIEMEEQSVGETLEEKLEDFAEVIPDIGETGDEEEKKEGEDDLPFDGNKEVDESPVSNGHSIVTEATIEAHDNTDLDKSMAVSANSLLWRGS